MADANRMAVALPEGAGFSRSRRCEKAVLPAGATPAGKKFR